MDRGAWPTMACGVAKSRTGLKWLSMRAYFLFWFYFLFDSSQSAAAAKSLQSCPSLCDPIDGSPPGSAVPGILQARTLEWVAMSFSSACKWKGKVKSLSRVWLLATSWTAAYQAPPSMGFSRQEYWSGVPLPSSVLVHRYPIWCPHKRETKVGNVKRLLHLCSLWTYFPAGLCWVRLSTWPSTWSSSTVSALKLMKRLKSPRWSWKNAGAINRASNSPCWAGQVDTSQQSGDVRGVGTHNFSPIPYLEGSRIWKKEVRLWNQVRFATNLQFCNQFSL